MKLLLQNLQSGANISKGYYQFPFLIWKYFLPHSQEPIEQIAKYITKENIDFGLFTEADAGSFRTKYIDEIALISKVSGLNYNHFFLTTNFRKVTNQGNAIVSKYPIIETKSYKLSGTGEARFLCQSTIKIKNKKITLFVTHLTLSRKERQEQLKEINNILKNTRGTKIFAGDLNIMSEDELKHIDSLKRVSFLKTYPSWNPKMPLDNIFISEDIKKYNLSTTKIKMSDHLGLVLEFK
ncbi:MAG: endonuclease/exonuclease/phosphatase family protein [Candidatus Woesearchaeota archaeon]